MPAARLHPQAHVHGQRKHTVVATVARDTPHFRMQGRRARGVSIRAMKAAVTDLRHTDAQLSFGELRAIFLKAFEAREGP
jgi:hypothetical protein